MEQTNETGMKPAGAESCLTAGLAATADELRTICDATVRLTEIRQRGCGHLCVENVAPEIMRKLLIELVMHKKGFIRAEDFGSMGIDG